MSIDWADLAKAAGDGGFQVLPNGEYDVWVQSANGGKTSTAKDRVRVTFKVENGPHAGQVVVNDFVVTPDNPNAMAIFFRNMSVLGVDAGWFAANPKASIELVATTVQAKRARLRLRTSAREWAGQTRTNVDQLLPPLPGTAASAPAAPGTLPASSPVPQVPRAPVPGVPELPDDLPF